MSTPASITGKMGRLSKNTTGTKNGTGSLRVLEKSDAVDANSGGLKVTFTKGAGTKTDYRCGAKNVRTKPPTNAAECGHPDAQLT